MDSYGFERCGHTAARRRRREQHGAAVVAVGPFPEKDRTQLKLLLSPSSSFLPSSLLLPALPPRLMLVRQFQASTPFPTPPPLPPPPGPYIGCVTHLYTYIFTY